MITEDEFIDQASYNRSLGLYHLSPVDKDELDAVNNAVNAYFQINALKRTINVEITKYPRIVQAFKALETYLS